MTPLTFNHPIHAIRYYKRRLMYVEEQIMILAKERESILANLDHNKKVLEEEIQKKQTEGTKDAN